MALGEINQLGSIPKSPTSLSHHDANASSSDRSATIQRVKDKAKASKTPAGGNSANATKTEVDATGSVTISRKRSRSGSRKANVLRHDDKGIYSIDTETDRFRFLTFYERDNDFNAVLSKSELPWHKKLLESKVDEANFLKTDMTRARLEHPGQVFGPGYMGYGNGTTNVPSMPGRQALQLLLPSQKPRLGRRTAPRVFIPRKDMSAQADIGEELVPIRLDIEHDKIKLRDTFTWNLHDHLTNPTAFARSLVEDFKIPHESFEVVENLVMVKLKEQITDYYPHVFINNTALDHQLPYYAYKNDEMRILIKLNITIGSHTLIDQLEWEINDPMNNPEEFAQAMARDMSLSGEFTTAIAHQIREQSQMFTKSLYITSHPFDGRPIEDADVRDNFLSSPVPSVFRPFQSAKEFTPYLYELNEGDRQREELSILRDQRRQKRSVTRRGGPALPDLKDKERTIRSLLVSSVLPGAAEALESARVFKYSRSSGRGKRPGRVDEGESEESESEDSEVDAEPTPQITTSSRGRVMRTAASQASAAMKANLGRSATPEVMNAQYEQRMVPRKSGLDREESLSEPPQSLIVKLRIPKDILRQLQNPRVRLETFNTTSGGTTPQEQAGRPPVSAQKSLAVQYVSASDGKEDDQWNYDAEGRINLAGWPSPKQEAPPLPDWLPGALVSLRERYPDDSFEAFMKLHAIDKANGNAPVRPDQLAQDKPKPDNIKLQFVPRVRCHDCPGTCLLVSGEFQNRADREFASGELGPTASFFFTDNVASISTSMMIIKENSVSLRIITHNIRYATLEPFKGEELWPIRAPKLLSQLTFNARHNLECIICLQEVLHGQLQDVLTGLNNKSATEWTHIGVGRDDGRFEGEYSPILYRPGIWKLAAFKTIWLSETPWKPSKSWDAASVRLLTIGVLLHRRTNQLILAMNTHLDDQGIVARAKAAELIASTMREYSAKYHGSLLFLAGDLNSTIDDKAYQLLTSRASPVQDARSVVDKGARWGEENTFTGFGHEAPQRIDFVLSGKDECTVDGYAVLPNRFEDKVYVSDHRAVVVDMRVQVPVSYIGHEIQPCHDEAEK